MTEEQQPVGQPVMVETEQRVAEPDDSIGAPRSGLVATAAPPDNRLKEELQGWHQAKEAAKNHNRNLRQYGAGIGALIAFALGSSSLLALAGALLKVTDGSPIPFWAFWALIGAGIAGAVVLVVLVGLLIRALLLRKSAERRADEHRGELIAIDPDLFPPNREE